METFNLKGHFVVKCRCRNEYGTWSWIYDYEFE